MDEWEAYHHQQQQQQRLARTTIGPMHSSSSPSRPSPYPNNEIKQTYRYPSAPQPDFHSALSAPSSYAPIHTEQFHQTRMANSTPLASYHPGHYPYPPVRTRPMPASHCSSPMSPHSSSPQATYYQHWHPHQAVTLDAKSHANLFDGSSTRQNPAEKQYDSPTSYHTSVCSNTYFPAQQLPGQSLSQDYQAYGQHTHIFPSPSSNPSTPYQNEFNAEFGVPYQHGQPSSVGSLTDALCPSGEIIDRQFTPASPMIGASNGSQQPYSFPHTPSTPGTRARSTNEQSIDELTAFLQDPMHLYLTDDFRSTLYDDIEALADTYLGTGYDQQSTADNSLDYDIILNFLCSDDLISTVCRN